MNFFTKSKQAFTSFIDTCKALTEASRAQTTSITALHSDLKKLEQHAKYLATAERQRLQREGRPHEFV